MVHGVGRRAVMMREAMKRRSSADAKTMTRNRLENSGKINCGRGGKFLRSRDLCVWVLLILLKIILFFVPQDRIDHTNNPCARPYFIQVPLDLQFIFIRPILWISV